MAWMQTGESGRLICSSNCPGGGPQNLFLLESLRGRIGKGDLEAERSKATHQFWFRQVREFPGRRLLGPPEPR